MIDFNTIKNHVFIEEEFNDPNYSKSGRYLDGTLMVLLLRLRFDTDWPIIPHGKVGGCIDIDGTWGHADKSLHRFDQGCKAIDFHFITTSIE